MAYDEVTAQLVRENEQFRDAFKDLLSVRDQFAKAALPLFLELEVTGVWNQSLPDAVSKRDHAMQVARASYWMADAMMAVRGAAPAPSAPADQPSPDKHQRLMKFYGVDSLTALVDAQAYHVEKLQAKLPPTPSLAPQRVREG